MGLNGKQKKEVTNIAKNVAKKFPGPQGPVGPQGAKGGAGAPGKDGNDGEDGNDGSPWTAGGTLPVGSTETGGWSLPFIAENGVPLGAETYDTAISFPVQLAEELKPEQVHFINAAGEEVYFENGEGKEKAPTECLGTAAEPTANSGHLCVYTGSLSAGSNPGTAFAALKYVQPIRTLSSLEPGASVAGALLRFHVEAGGHGFGSWAVTG